jgi:formamidase
VRDIDLSIVHFLSGPIGVHGAEPGDLLVVDLLDVGALPESLWGFNGFFSKKNGGGFLTDHFPLAQKSIWDISGLYTSSRHVPGVSFAGLIHPGLIGCLPDQEARYVEQARG